MTQTMKREIISGMLALAFMATHAQTLRDDVSLSDPFIMADPQSNAYYMTGTAGDIFKSTDLEVWTKLPWALQTGDIPWVGIDHKSPSPGEIWAPELYHKDGAYYNVVTFTNPNAKTEGTNHTRRSIHILKSNKPEGPYKKIAGGDELYLPANKMAIDGSIWEEDGKLYLIYCYEWVQAGDGAIEYIELKPDLTGTVGTSHHICKASDGRAWNTDAVTDGCFIFRTQTGRLGMIWTGWRSGVYVQGVSYSDNGKLTGKWSHSKSPITPDNHGHGMLFRNFDGQLLMSIHSNRNIDLNSQKFERHPTLFVMDDSGDELRAVMKYKPKYSITTPTDVVVRNAGFDYSTSEWTCTTKAQNKTTASNQSGAITGKYFENWDANSFEGEIYQEQTLPNGTYKVSAAAFRSYPIAGATDDDSAVCLFANDEVCQLTSATPETYSITVHVTDGKLRYGIRSNKKNYQWMGIDNVSIQYYGAEYVSAEDIDNANENSAVYLKNKKSGLFLNCGKNWGTQAVLSSHALDLHLIELPNGKFAIDTQINNGSTNHYVGSNGYMDAGMAEFSITELESGTYTLSTTDGQYWGTTVSNTVSTSHTSAQSAAAQWEIKTKSDLIAEFSNATIDNPIDATFLIKGGNFGRNDTRIEANWTGKYELGGDVTNQCAQAPSEAFNISQTVTNVPNGVYELRVQGFHRHGSANTAPLYKNKGQEKLNAYLYANDEKSPLMSIFEHADHSSIPSAEADETTLGKLPANLTAASAMFSAGLYTNKLLVQVTDDTLTVGVKKSTGASPSNNWTAFDNFELYYLGTEMPSAINVVEKELSNRNTGIYSLDGQKINSLDDIPTNTSKKIYIVNGKKMLLP